jgi:hypothetical protein
MTDNIGKAQANLGNVDTTEIDRICLVLVDMKIEAFGPFSETMQRILI